MKIVYELMKTYLFLAALVFAVLVLAGCTHDVGLVDETGAPADWALLPFV